MERRAADRKQSVPSLKTRLVRICSLGGGLGWVAGGKADRKTRAGFSHLLLRSPQGALCENVYINKKGIEVITRMNLHWSEMPESA